MPVAEIKLLIGVQSYCLRSQMMAFRLSCGGGGQTLCEVPDDRLRATWGGPDGSLSDHRPCRSPVSPIPAASAIVVLSFLSLLSCIVLVLVLAQQLLAHASIQASLALCCRFGFCLWMLLLNP
jgi:hypothetical protein